MNVQSFLELDTETYTHILIDDSTQRCAIIDPVLGYDFKSGQTNHDFIDGVIRYVQAHNLVVDYIIETHAHADHLSSAQYLKAKLGGKLVIGKYITEVQQIFKEVYHLDTSFKTDASQFDILTDEGSVLQMGNIKITAMHVPGHTPADMAYVAQSNAEQSNSEQSNLEQSNFDPNTSNRCASKFSGDKDSVVFVGDTLFAPDVGTARCDFPGGDAQTLYRSIQKILALPEDTKIYLCHDYPPEGRKHSPVTTVAEEKKHNKHVHDGISEAAFVQMRRQRDATLEMPRLIIPAVQVNIRAGDLPEPEDNGVRYLKIPINVLS